MFMLRRKSSILNDIHESDEQDAAGDGAAENVGMDNIEI
jgi:hypothetical protein